MAPTVSVVIPTRNAGPEFRRTLAMIRAQDIANPVEIVVVDSRSCAGPLELCREFDVAIHSIVASDFNHGATRNLAIARTCGAYIALTVQDAVPLDCNWLASMVQNLDRLPQVAGVYSRQVPRPDCDPCTRQQLESWWTSSQQWRLQRVDDWDGFCRLDPARQQALSTFDNVSSCIRRTAWEQYPFPVVRFAEDLRWACHVLRAGWHIVYEPKSAVIHSHDRSAWYELKRHYVCHKTLYGLFGLHTVPELARVPRNVCGEVRRRWTYLRKQGLAQGRLFWRAATLSVVSQLGQYLGAKADRLLAGGARWFAAIDRLLSRGV